MIYKYILKYILMQLKNIVIKWKTMIHLNNRIIVKLGLAKQKDI